MKLLLFTCALVAAVMAQSELEKVLKTGNDQFTANMFQEVVKKQKGKSCVLSAFSVLSPLAQLALASVGESHDEILRTIGFANDNVTKEVFTDVNKRLKSVSGVELKQANKVYVRNGYSLNDDFTAVSKAVFDSEVQNIDFDQNKKAADEINTWVEDHTNKRIKNLVDPDSINSDTAAILVNAIYFKGKWKNPFSKERTHDLDFHVSKDETIKVPMMTQTTDFKYFESAELDAKFLELPYEGDETSLVVALPNKVDGIDDLVNKISKPDALDNALNQLTQHEVDVVLPKFKIETTTNLREVLQNMNVKKLFSAKDAQLNNLLKERGDLYVSDAVQKAFIEVNEEGAEAAAANHFIILSRSGKFILNVNQFKADRPFFYMLKHKSIVIFNGIFYS